jgi:hypothetical protein
MFFFEAGQNGKLWCSGSQGDEVIFMKEGMNERMKELFQSKSESPNWNMSGLCQTQIKNNVDVTTSHRHQKHAQRI